MPGDADRVSALVAEVGLREADGLPLWLDEDDLVLAAGEDAADQAVPVLELDPAQAALAGRIRVVGDARLLRDSVLRRHDEVEACR